LTQTADPKTQHVPSLDLPDDAPVVAAPDLRGVPGGRPPGATRRIELAGLSNLRDVGGYPAAGGEVRWRTLYRSDALHRLDADGVAVVAGLGLRTIVDLRTHAETEIAPTGQDQLAARSTHISILGGGDSLESLPLELDAIYRYIIDQRGDEIAAAIGVLCADGALPGLVHCSAGKDRTGIVVALILAVLGVPDELIAADYALSSVCLDPGRTPVIGRIAEDTRLGDKLTAGLLASPPALISSVLGRVRAAGGSVDGYLISHGLSPADLSSLRAALSV
jgi:protein-tyrosine phosphatase